MTKHEAMEILSTKGEDEATQGEIDGIIIMVYPIDIRSNLKSNGWELDLEYTQDLTAVINGNFELFQGHSLEEVILN